MAHEETKQYLNNLITQQQDHTTDSRRHIAKQLPMSWVIKLFSKFQIIYGHKWLSLIDTDELSELAMQEWGERLAGLTGDEIVKGLANIPREWPPTPMEFKELCVGSLDHNTKAYRPFDKSRAIELKPDKELAVKSMQEIKRLLNKGD